MTDLPLREHFEALLAVLTRDVLARLDSAEKVTDAKFTTLKTVIESQADKVALALAAADKAVTKSEISIDKRVDLLNELRNDVATKGQMDGITQRLGDLTDVISDMRAHYATKEQVNGLTKSVAELQGWRQKAEGRAGGIGATMTAAISAVTVIVIIVNLGFYLATR